MQNVNRILQFSDFVDFQSFIDSFKTSFDPTVGPTNESSFQNYPKL